MSLRSETPVHIRSVEMVVPAIREEREVREFRIRGGLDMPAFFNMVGRLIRKDEFDFIKKVYIEVPPDDTSSLVLGIQLANSNDWQSGNHINPNDRSGNLVPFSGLIYGTLHALPAEDATKLAADLSLVPQSRRNP